MSCFMKRLAVLIDGVARKIVTGVMLFIPLMATPQVFAAQIVRVAAVHFPLIWCALKKVKKPVFYPG